MWNYQFYSHWHFKQFFFRSKNIQKSYIFNLWYLVIVFWIYPKISTFRAAMWNCTILFTVRVTWLIFTKNFLLILQSAMCHLAPKRLTRILNASLNQRPRHWICYIRIYYTISLYIAIIIYTYLAQIVIYLLYTDFFIYLVVVSIL